MSAREEEKKASFLWSLGEKLNNIVPGLAPGSVRGQTAQGGWEFMKTAEYVALMTGLKSVSLRNLKGGLGPSELVLTCGCSPSLLASYQALCFPEPVFIPNPTNCTIM